MANPNPFQQFHVAVKGVITAENKALIVRVPNSKWWEMPGGRISENEWFEFFIIFHINFKAIPKVKLEEEHAEYRWVGIEELDGVSFRTDTQFNIYKKALSL